MKYERPEIIQIGTDLTQLISKFKEAKSFEQADDLLMKINKIRNDFDSMKIMALINYSLDTNDKTAAAEQNYFDNNNPLFAEYVTGYYKALNSSQFKNEFIKKYGKQLFDVAEISLKNFDPSIIGDMQHENELASEYVKLKASANITFDGKKLNLQELDPLMESTDRSVRLRAFDAYWNFFSENKKDFEGIYDRLIKLRNGMAIKMGYKNFVELGYARMKRIDYNEEMVDKFRENVKKYIVPLASKLREKQRKRLHVDKLMFHDIYIQFNSGNATPKGNPEWIMQNGKKMYAEMSDETKEFYDFMFNNELMDVYSRHGKADTGFCENIAKYKSPFIFANMNGTEDDITVLTHEAGHAFQAYCSRDFLFKEYIEPSFETAEIHSMSMEFLTYPWISLFFENDTDKFKFAHLNSTTNFLPYGVLVDHFQHWVYQNPDITTEERNAKWRELEHEYMPHLDFGDNKFLETGGRWQRQSHIYEVPFYYIDYCLAQVIAFQFWSKAIHADNGKYENCLSDYVSLCKKGGSKSFLQLVKEANLESPFDENVMKRLVAEIETYLDEIDDSKF